MHRENGYEYPFLKFRLGTVFQREVHCTLIFQDSQIFLQHSVGWVIGSPSAKTSVVYSDVSIEHSTCDRHRAIASTELA